MDKELRDARRSGDRYTLLKVLFRRTPCLGDSMGFNWSPFRRTTDYTSARLRVVELLKPDWSGVKGIRWNKSVTCIGGFAKVGNWIVALKEEAAKDINHQEPTRRLEARRQLKSILRMEANLEIERTKSFSFIDFYVVSTLNYEPKNRREKREVAKLRADFSDWLPEMTTPEQRNLHFKGLQGSFRGI